PGCGKQNIVGMRICEECARPLQDGDVLAEAENQQQAHEFTEKVHVAGMRVIDRGARDSRTQAARKMRKLLKRARMKHGQPTGFNTIKERFLNDDWFRSEFEKIGWTEDNIHRADEMAQGDCSMYNRRTQEHRDTFKRYIETDTSARQMSSSQGATVIRHATTRASPWTWGSHSWGRAS
ncbi:MAG: hypothetical protein GY768_31700, partial [Planctomycetaceae bacterium]|nr:hypothetical protein [Planctomycetaceae bacterium]